MGHNSTADSISMVGYDAELTWRPTRKIVVWAAANDAVEPTPDEPNNYMIVSVMQASGTWHLNDSFSTTLFAFFTHEYYDQNIMVGSSEIRKRDDTTGAQ